MRWLLTIVLMTGINADSQVWRIDEQQLLTPITSMSGEQRLAIMRAIEPQLRSEMKTNWIEKAEIGAVKRSIRTQRITTATGSLLLMQGGWGTAECSGTGNCAVWVLDNHYRLLLGNASGTRIEVLKAAHHDQPDILIAAHESANEESRVTYVFNGVKYRPAVCMEVSFSDLQGNPYKRPHAEPSQCH